jgi:hypothetical protein
LTTGSVFVVEWPIGPGVSPPPDDATVVAANWKNADRNYSPVFVSLVDGRLDLLPAAADRTGGTGFTWGYGGGGPYALTEALYQLVLPGGGSHRGVRWEALSDLVVGWRRQELSISVRELREIVANAPQAQAGPR